VKPGPGLYRPSEANLPRGDAGKTRRPLGWTNRIGFEELVREKVDEDCRAPGIERAKA
jgi:GDPmannose 4,6-dehydratase